MTAPVVLNTRPREQAAELSRLLLAAGLRPLEAPCIEVEPGWSSAELAAVLAGLRAGAYTWVVLPSRNAARCLLDGLRAAGGGAGDLTRSRVLSGAGTAQYLAGQGVQVQPPLARFSALAALAALEPAVLAGRRVLVPRAAGGRDELIDGLRAQGVAVDAPVLYRSRPVDPSRLREAGALLERGAVAAVAFTSPSTVHALVDGLAALGLDAAARLGQPAIVCIGQTTADAVGRRGLRVARLAEQTTLESLVDAVAGALAAAGVGA